MTGSYAGFIDQYFGYYSFNVNARLLVYPKVLAETANMPFYYPFNNRFQGPRESYKFKALADTIVMPIAFSLAGINSSIGNMDAQSYTPTASKIADLYHIRAQIEFQEYLTAKTTNVTWFG